VDECKPLPGMSAVVTTMSHSAHCAENKAISASA
jgi:hypothetical protein